MKDHLSDEFRRRNRNIESLAIYSSYQNGTVSWKDVRFMQKPQKNYQSFISLDVKNMVPQTHTNKAAEGQHIE